MSRNVNPEWYYGWNLEPADDLDEGRCDRCGGEYSEYAYCGLCPTCADETE